MSQGGLVAAPGRPELGPRVRRLVRPRPPSVVAVGTALLVLPLLVPAAHLVARGGDYSLTGDQAIIEMHVRGTGTGSVLVGPYSRYGWSHPGPAIYYLLAPLYWLSGGSSRSLTVTALLVNAACVAGIALLVRRHAGPAAAVWALVVLAVYLRVIGAAVLRDPWNPFLPVLPFALTVLLAWAALRGDAWALPAAVAVGTFAVQSHVGFLLGVAAVLGVAGAGLAARAVHGGRVGWSGRPGRARLGSLAATGLVLAAMWAAPVAQQLTGHPGNLGELVAHFRSARPSSTYATGLSWLSAEAGALPAYVVGVPQAHPFSTPPSLPGWAGVAALLAFLLASAVAVRRRAGAAGWLAALCAAVCVAGVVAVQRVPGPLFDYLVRWVVVAGLVLWISVGVSLLGRVWGVRAGATGNEVRPTSTPHTLAAGAALAAVGVLAGLATADGVRAQTGWTSTDGALPRLAAQARGWLGPRAADPVRVDFGPTTRPVFLGTATPGAGLVLLLAKQGVHVQLTRFWDGAYGTEISADLDRVRWVLVLAYADGSSPPPAPGQRVVARAGELQVYGGPAVR